MLNIELPWIDGLRLTRRWYPFVLTEDVDYEELHHCIFESGLPVYNFDRELQEGIVDKFTAFPLTHIFINVAKDAVSNGFIGISHLVFIMASDENYTKNLILTQLIENMFSELQERKDYYFGFKELSISDYKSRIDVWHELIHHWVKGNNEYFRDKYKNYLPLYYLNPTTKDLDRFDHKKMHDQLIQERQKEKSDELSIEERIEVSKIINYIARFVKLSELKKYLVDVIGIPLPSLLFPKDIETKHKKLRPSQKAKNECRKIAKKIWGENPQITIADMINHDDLLSYTTKKDGNFYTEKTVRNWIKNLCPDRSRGRRKST